MVKRVRVDLNLVDHLVEQIQETYEDIMRERQLRITVAEGEYTKQVAYSKESIYRHPLCLPFTQEWTIYKKDIYFIVMEKEYELYDHGIVKRTERPLLSTLMDGATKCGTIQTTMVKFHHDKYGGTLPYNSIHLYRNKRCYGSWDHLYSIKNGSKNYNQTRIDIYSKELAKRLGLTFNKSISDDIVNVETCAFKEFIKHINKGVNADTSTAAYKKLEQKAMAAGIMEARAEPVPVLVPVKYFRGTLTEEHRLCVIDYLTTHPEITKDEVFKKLFNHMCKERMISVPM
jgi:hypothetical protein